ncbi:MAG: histidine kinase [Bacteroidales bacterium]|nr:histidine kinase [Bacteroidales bacterium]
MNAKANDNVEHFLSLRRIFFLSFVISVGFHLLFALSFFFGESLILGSEKSPMTPCLERAVHPTVSDTIHCADAQQVGSGKPMKQRDVGQTPVKPKKFRYGKMLVHIMLSFLLVFALFWLNRELLGVKYTKRWREVFFVVLGSILTTTVLSIAFSYLIVLVFDPTFPDSPFPFRMIRDCLVRDYSLMAVVVMACYLLRSLFHQRAIAVENEALRTENIRSHYETLKNQLDPHFLFNSMNTLQSLIELDTEKAGDYVQQLSSVLRYTLKSKEVVSLADEMACVEAYCSMMQIRYGDSLTTDFQVDKKYNSYMVLPLAVQGLVENAIKHNVISAKQPLVIRIATSEDAVLEIGNAIHPKIKDEVNDGIGLANLAERYWLQWNKEILIRNDGDYFKVFIPLVEKQ